MEGQPLKNNSSHQEFQNLLDKISKIENLKKMK